MTQTVLITGASGFVASWVVRSFLEAGYNVKGTVRSEDAAEGVRKTHKSYLNQLSLALVPDVSTPGAFDNAVKGVDGVIHTASPFYYSATDFEKELYTPAINGTLEVLKAVKAHAPNVKRVVITSSFAAVINLAHLSNKTYSEKDWNPFTKEQAGNNPVASYLVSKTLAEQAAFKFVETERPNFNICTLLPPTVYGPIIHKVPSLDRLNTSSKDLYRFVNGAMVGQDIPPTKLPSYVDVRDLGNAHRLAYEKAEAAGQRYLVVASRYIYPQLAGHLRQYFPELKERIPEGDINAPFPESLFKIDTSKSARELGLLYRPFRETLVDSINSFRELEEASVN